MKRIFRIPFRNGTRSLPVSGAIGSMKETRSRVQPQRIDRTNSFGRRDERDLGPCLVAKFKITKKNSGTCMKT